MDREGKMRRGGRLVLFKAALLFIASLVVFVSVMVFKLKVHNRILDIGYEISQENSTRRTLAQEKKQMDLEVQYLRSPERIRQIAQDQYAMKIPGSSQIIHMKAGKKKKK
jgi:cell division protein FtsL